VERLTEAQLAERSGASVQDIRRLTEHGVLNPGDHEPRFSLGDLRRIRLALSCEEGGIPLEAIGQAIRDRKLSLGFLDLPHYSIFAELSDTTFEGLERQSGLPMEVLVAIREAMGGGRPDPRERVRGDDLEVIPTVQLAREAGVPDEALIRLLRVYGESLRRVADAETYIYHSYFELPLLASGMTQAQILESASAASEHFSEPLVRSLTAIYHRQQEHAWIGDMVEHVETALEEAGLTPRVARPPAMCFLDLAGYTRLTEERGDRAAAEMAASLSDIVTAAAGEYRGRAVKWVGDGVMFHFPFPGPAVSSALEMVASTPEAGLPPAHVGIDAGPVVFQDGDFFGRTVNMAARVSDRAGPGQVLVTDRVVEAISSDGPPSDGFEFRELGPAELKGIPQPVVLFEASDG
jgi:adenylate cyclase